MQWKFSKSGGMISLNSKNALGDNIFEVISVPYPVQIEVDYTVNFLVSVYESA